MNANTITFSIIVPVYNVEKYLNQCIESIINQTYTNFEIILVDDGSSDRSGEICDQYVQTNTRIKVIHKQNGGLSSARNAGMQLAEGEYILFIDSDDWIDIDALSIIAGNLDNSIDILIFSFIYYFSSDNQITNNISFLTYIDTTREYAEFVAQNRVYNQCIAWNKVYRKSFLTQNNCNFIEGILHEDGPFFFNVMSYSGTIKIIDTPLYYYRKNRLGAITSFNTKKNFYSLLTGISNIQNRWENKNINFVLLNMYIFACGQKYQSDTDIKTVIATLRQPIHKKAVRMLLFNSYFRFNTFMLGILLWIDPKLLRYSVKLI